VEPSACSSERHQPRKRSKTLIDPSIFWRSTEAHIGCDPVSHMQSLRRCAASIAKRGRSRLDQASASHLEVDVLRFQRPAVLKLCRPGRSGPHRLKSRDLH